MKITSTILLGALAAFALSAVPACGDAKDEPKADDKKDAKAKDDKKGEEKKGEEKKVDDGKEGAKADAGTNGGAADGKLGVAECDEYVEKYSKCIENKVPEGARGSMKEAMNATVKAWREAAAGPAKDGLGTACKAALDAAKAATLQMGCEW